MASNEEEIKKTQDERKKMEQQLASLTSLNFDTDLYGASDKDSYNTSIPANEDEEILEPIGNEAPRRIASITGPKSHFIDMPSADNDGVGGGDGFRKPQSIIDREDEYRRRRLNQLLSPDRHDAFAAGEKTPDPSARTYADIMREEALKREKEETLIPLAHLCQRDTIVVLAGVVAALKLIGGTLPEHTFLFIGARETGIDGVNDAPTFELADI